MILSCATPMPRAHNSPINAQLSGCVMTWHWYHHHVEDITRYDHFSPLVLVRTGEDNPIHRVNTGVSPLMGQGGYDAYQRAGVPLPGADGHWYRTLLPEFQRLQARSKGWRGLGSQHLSCFGNGSMHCLKQTTDPYRLACSRPVLLLRLSITVTTTSLQGSDQYPWTWHLGWLCWSRTSNQTFKTQKSSSESDNRYKLNEYGSAVILITSTELQPGLTRSDIPVILFCRSRQWFFSISFHRWLLSWLQESFFMLLWADLFWRCGKISK